MPRLVAAVTDAKKNAARSPITHSGSRVTSSAATMDAEALASAARLAAEGHKAIGNAHFAKGEHAAAIEAYGVALDALPAGLASDLKCAVHSNRAACHLKLGDHEACVADCTEALKIDGSKVRGPPRRASRGHVSGQGPIPPRQGARGARRPRERFPRPQGPRRSLDPRGTAEPVLVLGARREASFDRGSSARIARDGSRSSGSL